MARNKNKVKQDKKGEKIVHQFLLEHFYLDEVDNKEVMDSDMFGQLHGIDTFFFKNGFKYKCDEKAALDYVNKPKKLNTFCLELSCLNTKDELMEGWFTNDEMETNSYLFAWVDKAKKYIIDCVDDILEVEVMLVLKQDIYDYFKSIGWDKDKLRRKCNNIRYNDDRNMGNYYTNGCKFSFVDKLPEQPINVLLTRDVYRNMPHTINKVYKME